MNPEWKDVHEQLQASMKQEIRAMREMLANMRQEEECLLTGDKNRWNRIMIERSTLLEILYELRSQRFLETKQLEHLAKDAALPMENLLSPEDEESCEILSMREQLAALIEKMNQQNLRNQSLEGREFFPARERLMQHGLPQAQLVKRNKTIIATYPEKP